MRKETFEYLEGIKKALEKETFEKGDIILKYEILSALSEIADSLLYLNKVELPNIRGAIMGER